MFINEKIEVTWTPANRKYYESLGYIYEYRGKFNIKSSELPKGSKIKIKVKCDYCGNIIERSYRDYIRRKQSNVLDKDCCKKCLQLKVKETNKKIIEENPNYYNELHNRTKRTMIEKYGVENPMQLDETKEKIKATNIEKYGVPYYAMTDEWLDKVKQTSLEHYGVESPMKNKEVKNKLRKTLYDNGTAPRSRQQIYICNLLNGILNYPLNGASLDIAFPNQKIYLEYNGGGHWLSIKLGTETEEQFKQRARKRWYALHKNGWKQIKIKSINDFIPSDEVIVNIFNDGKQILNSGRSWVEFDIDEHKIKTSKFIRDYDFGSLRRIYKNTVNK